MVVFALVFTFSASEINSCSCGKELSPSPMCRHSSELQREREVSETMELDELLSEDS